jgi:hypothetical protein
MRSNALVRACTVLGLGLAGLVGGHALGYAIAVPDDVHRTALLGATGHGYMPSMSRLAVMLGVAAVVGGIALGYLHRPRGGRFALARTAVMFALLQCGGFVALEIVERVLASAPLGSLSIGLLVAGLLSQIVVAIVLALVLVGLRTLGSWLGVSAGAPVASGRREPIAFFDLPRRSRARDNERVRGPPAARLV